MERAGLARFLVSRRQPQRRLSAVVRPGVFPQLMELLPGLPALPELRVEPEVEQLGLL